MAEEEANFVEQEISEFFSYALPNRQNKHRKPLIQISEVKSRFAGSGNPKSQEKLEQIRVELKRREMEECTFKPNINRNIQVEPRYYRPQRKKPVQKQNLEDESQWTFKPKICQQSIRLKRGNKVDQILYKDFLRRKHHQQLLLLPKPDISICNLKTGKIAGEKFVKQFSKLISSYELQSPNLEIYKMHKAMVDLGFVTTEKILMSHVENHLIYEAYEILEEEAGVRVRNLAVFLLAVLGIFNVEGCRKGSRIHRKKEQDDKEVGYSKFGNLIDQDGNFNINRTLGIKLQKHFKVFYVNRLARPKQASRSPTPNKSFSSTSKTNLKTLSPSNFGRLNTQPANPDLQHSNVYRWMAGQDQLSVSSFNHPHQTSLQCHLQRSKFSNQPNINYNPNLTTTMFSQSTDSFPLTEYLIKPTTMNITKTTKITKTHLKSKSEIVVTKRPLFILEVKIRTGVVDLPIYHQAKKNPRRVIDQFVEEHELDGQSRDRLYQTLCQSLVKYGE